MQALVLTLAVELVVALVLMSALRWLERPQLRRTVLVVIAATLVTHPVAWWASVVGLNGWVWADKATFIETAVVVVEAGILAGAVPMRVWRAGVTAATMNLASFGAGIALS